MATDYALIAAILIVVIIGAVNALSGGLGELFQDISSGLGGSETE
ncbi:MAG: Flp family type IVb pilin [Alphaproteobacteria bacterium]|nr:Flp family type IVb pilin [Alphaproteobacteria bacterium]